MVWKIEVALVNPWFMLKLNCGLFTFPLLVVMMITPLAPRIPKTAVADASFNTLMDSTSLGSIAFKIA